MKRFTKNDEGFVCKNCGFKVEPLGYTSRNHCPKCLCSLHVDIMPGDRANPCGGIMDAVSAEPDAKRGFVLLHKCRICGQITKNKAATEAAVQPDNINMIIELTAKQINEGPKSWEKPKKK